MHTRAESTARTFCALIEYSTHQRHGRDTRERTAPSDTRHTHTGQDAGHGYAKRYGRGRAHGRATPTAHTTRHPRKHTHQTRGAAPQHSRGTAQQGGIGHTHPQHQTHSTGRQKTSSHPRQHSERTPTTSHRHQRHSRDTAGAGAGHRQGAEPRHHSTASQHHKTAGHTTKIPKKIQKIPKNRKIQKNSVKPQVTPQKHTNTTPPPYAPTHAHIDRSALGALILYGFQSSGQGRVSVSCAV